MLVVDRLLKATYQEVAKVNPAYFGNVADVDPASSKWTWPTTASVVYFLEAVAGGGGSIATGTPINRIQLEDKASFDAPRVYRLGRAFYSVGETGDPLATAGGSRLRFHFAMKHPALDAAAALDAAGNTLDGSWNEDFNAVLIQPLGRYLAAKDGRPEAELQGYTLEEARWRELLLQEALLSDHGQLARFSDGRLPGPTAGGR